MRAQASLELFFAMSLFVLMLFWFNHFVGVAGLATDASRVAAVRSAAYSLSQSADAACLSRSSVSISSPCFSFSEPVLLNASGRVLAMGNVSVPTRCPFEPGQAVAYACGQPWCFFTHPNGTMRLLEGSCP
ncbi:hypothetical protein HYV43_07305 [Candidatus Micrarchaeota archaeon]|nr:hypothetical protein [Candidatus Micrarchaeota archaeon]